MVTGSSKWGTPYILGDDDQPHCHRPNRVSVDSMWRFSVARVWNSVGLGPLFSTLFICCTVFVLFYPSVL